ncbi:MULTISPECIES: rhodanese-like domain-containing protein [Sphingobacterium]|uniref:rhodanese-like domain-containing protein n=1 Tax=Sphingobacterium TaxID=28453 RepID=UPI0019660990|nr:MULTISPECIES: rhodanese-like domain-containing protein [Sphingobacterium]QRY59737.1 rhodanese-like domain-containing protein [Sphingobacterium siyangense]
MIYRIFFLLLFVALLGLYKLFSSSRTDSRLDRVLLSNPIILDVRSPAEFQKGHMNEAINIPIDSIEFVPLNKFDSTRPIITYCSHGVRSIRAVGLLKSRGLKHVYNGGSWEDLVTRLEDHKHRSAK